tara:strand:+ start:401 stop:862 length:462 start_codon:yes stop_codon:yes gene_type:complete
MKRYFKKCEEFSICGAFGEKDDILSESAKDNVTQFQIIVKGSGKVARPFESNFIELKNREITDLRTLIGSDRIYKSFEDFEMYGFNCIGKYKPWSARKIINSFQGDDNSWLICFDGRPIINGITLEKMNYVKLTNKKYDVDINDAFVGVFTKL